MRWRGAKVLCSTWLANTANSSSSNSAKIGTFLSNAGSQGIALGSSWSLFLPEDSASPACDRLRLHGRWNSSLLRIAFFVAGRFCATDETDCAGPSYGLEQLGFVRDVHYGAGISGECSLHD